MTITNSVKATFFTVTSVAHEELIRLPPTVVARYARADATARNKTSRACRTRRRTNLWTVEEHDRFLEGLEKYPVGPWKLIAEIIGTKTTRQTMTHAQKYREKIARYKQAKHPELPPTVHKQAIQESVENSTAHTKRDAFGVGSLIDIENLRWEWPLDVGYLDEVVRELDAGWPDDDVEMAALYTL